MDQPSFSLSHHVQAPMPPPATITESNTEQQQTELTDESDKDSEESYEWEERDTVDCHLPPHQYYPLRPGLAWKPAGTMCNWRVVLDEPNAASSSSSGDGVDNGGTSHDSQSDQNAVVGTSNMEHDWAINPNWSVASLLDGCWPILSPRGTTVSGTFSTPGTLSAASSSQAPFAEPGPCLTRQSSPGSSLTRLVLGGGGPCTELLQRSRGGCWRGARDWPPRPSRAMAGGNLRWSACASTARLSLEVFIRWWLAVDGARHDQDDCPNPQDVV